jgi:hypothetical protein
MGRRWPLLKPNLRVAGKFDRHAAKCLLCTSDADNDRIAAM